MNNSDSDIDAQMLLYADVQDNDPNSLTKPDDDKSKHKINFLFKLLNKRNNTIRYNIFILSLSLVKFIITIIAIAAFPSLCQAQPRPLANHCDHI